MEFACKSVEVEEIIACSLSLKKSEYKIFEAMIKESKKYSIQELSDKLKLDRTTIQKVLKKFVDLEIAKRYQQNLESGGYIFYYQIRDKNDLKKKIHSAIKKWNDSAVLAVDKW